MKRLGVLLFLSGLALALSSGTVLAATGIVEYGSTENDSISGMGAMTRFAVKAAATT